MRADVVVVGAGIIGVCVALHLQKRGRAVTLVDRRGAGEETSFGNAGLIQSEGVFPYGFPHDFGALVRYALRTTTDAHYHIRALPKLAPFLARYWWSSRPTRHAEIARCYAPLIRQSVPEHLSLAEEAGAMPLIRRRGWIKLFRTPAQMDIALREADSLRREYGVGYAALDPEELAEKEPHLDGSLVGGLHWTEPASVIDPHALTLAYVGLFERLGGRFFRGDAASLEPGGSGWRVATEAGAVAAAEAVVALGPWSDLVFRRLGYRIPSPSSAATTCTTRRAATPSSTTPCSTSSAAICWRRWRAASASPPAPSSPRATRRRRRFSSPGPSRSRGRCSRSASASMRSRGWARAPARPT
jgi:D-amino-acid dehydrogenase